MKCCTVKHVRHSEVVQLNFANIIVVT